MVKTAGLLVAGSLLAGSISILTAGPAHACFNPDEPTCRIHRVFCNETEPLAKYRDKLTYCYG